MPTSTSKGYPYPLDADRVDVSTDMRAIAEVIDRNPGVAAITETDRNALSGNQRWPGRVIINLTRFRAEIWDGVTWRTDIFGVQIHNLLGGRDALDSHPQYLSRDEFINHSHGGSPQVDALLRSLGTAKGDLAVWQSSGNPVRQAVGADGTQLVANSASSTGVSWGFPKSVGCKVLKNADQNVPNETTTFLSFQVEDDPQNIWNNATQRVTVPAGFAGRWDVKTGVTWSNAFTSGVALLKIEKNGVIEARTQFGYPNAGRLSQHLSVTIRAVVGDFFQIAVYQSTGGVLPVEATEPNFTWMSADYLGT